VSIKTIIPNFQHQFKKYFKVILLFSTILLFLITPARNLLDRQIFADYLQALGIWTVPIFIATYVILAMLGLPIVMHTLAGGVVFGLVWGTIWSAIAATLGAVGAFYLTRYVFQDWAIAKFGNHKLLKKFDRSIESNAFELILALRFTPIAPFNIINFLLALTPVKIDTYTIATFIGVIPGSIAYTWLGTSGKIAFQDGDQLQFICASIFLVFLSVLPILYKRWRFR
jgi:uncharacterized membrane protein YdjX (TVP38/TMEM64 family)